VQGSEPRGNEAPSDGVSAKAEEAQEQGAQPFAQAFPQAFAQAFPQAFPQTTWRKQLRTLAYVRRSSPLAPSFPPSL
jgi:hypothetical protein